MTDAVNEALEVTAVEPVVAGTASCGAPSQMVMCDIKSLAPGKENAVTIRVTFTAAAGLSSSLPDNLSKGEGDGSDFVFYFVSGKIIKGSTVEGSRNAILIDGKGEESVYDEPAGGGKNTICFTVGFCVHTSCSDEFEGGWGERDGPDEEDNKEWQISTYVIGKKKDGEVEKTCGGIVGDLEVLNLVTAIADGVDPAEASDTVLIVPSDDSDGDCDGKDGKSKSKSCGDKKKKRRQLEATNSEWW